VQVILDRLTIYVRNGRYIIILLLYRHNREVQKYVGKRKITPESPLKSTAAVLFTTHRRRRRRRPKTPAVIQDLMVTSFFAVN